MKFSNAYKGIKKIYLAEILSIIGLLCGIVMSVMLASAGTNLTATDALNGAVIGAGAMILVISLVSLLSFILSLVGIVQGKKDEDNFTYAMYCVLIGIVVSVLSSVLNNPAITRFSDNIGSICNGLATFFILSAVASLAGQLGDEALKTSALKARNVVTAGIVCVEVVKIILELFSTVNAVISVLTILSVLVQIVAYIYYLKILSRAKAALAR